MAWSTSLSSASVWRRCCWTSSTRCSIRGFAISGPDGAMAVSTSATTLVVARVPDQGHMRSVLGYLQRNPQLVAGLLMIGALVLFWSLGSVLVDVKTARPLSAQPELEPSFKYPLGTDTAGRNILAAMIVGTPITLRVGRISAGIGILTGTVLGWRARELGCRPAT